MKLSSAFHAQTDEQTERMNQVVEQYLRAYINYQQTNWVQYLLIAQFSYNSAINEITKMTSHYARFGYESNAYSGQYEYNHTVPEGVNTVQQWKQIIETLKDEIEFQNQRRCHYYNQHRQTKSSLKEEDEVYLL